jgi:glucose/arabinose dehydrogenase
MLVGGSIASTDPLGTLDSVVTTDGEQGLLSVAVDPRWPSSPFVYLLSTATDNTIRLSRLTLGGDVSNGASGTLAVVPGSRRELLRDIVSVHTNHNGGTLRFGTDSLLWASFGEDAIDCNATDTTALYGVLARMDVRALPAGPGPPDKALLVPPGNPYASRPDPDQR